jgi:hypothetical protein
MSLESEPVIFFPELLPSYRVPHLLSKEIKSFSGREFVGKCLQHIVKDISGETNCFDTESLSRATKTGQVYVRSDLT